MTRWRKKGGIMMIMMITKKYVKEGNVKDLTKDERAKTNVIKKEKK